MASSTERLLEDEQEKTTVTVLVTGANSGVGFGICCRLIDEFLLTRPQSQTLHLLFSTRDRTKSDDTLRRLNAHLQKALRSANGKLVGISLLSEARVKLEGVLSDLSNLPSVKRLAGQLLRRGEQIDAIIWNAGIGGWRGMNIAKGMVAILTDLIHETTFPSYNLGYVGLLTKPQTGGLKSMQNRTSEPEPQLGEVFTANVFGHYMLTHWLAPIFGPSSRIICTGSIGTVAADFSLDDIQCLGTPRAYESSKRLIIILALTSEMPSSQTSVRAFLDSPKDTSHGDSDGMHVEQRPKIYLAHPGLTATNIASASPITRILLFPVLYLSRLFGSPWFNVHPYKGASSAVWCALAPPEQLEYMEERDGKANWGASSDVYGNERVVRTETEGWGWCGIPGKMPSGSITGPKSRHRESKTTDREMREQFEDNGRRVWREMEELRVTWEKRLEDVTTEEDDGA